MLLDTQERAMLIEAYDLGDVEIYWKSYLSIERHLDRARDDEVRRIAVGGTKLKID